jgi:RNA polymerase sigma-70 factor (ECF subfamily)
MDLDRSEHPVDAAYLARLEEAVANLPGRQRDIFLARRLGGMAYGQISVRTGLSVRQVERHMARALYGLDLQMQGHKLRWWHRWF